MQYYNIIEETERNCPTSPDAPLPDASYIIPILISDPAFLKRKVLLAWDAGYDHRSYLQIIVGFDLREKKYCKKRKISQAWTWLS